MYDIYQPTALGESWGVTASKWNWRSSPMHKNFGNSFYCKRKTSFLHICTQSNERSSLGIGVGNDSLSWFHLRNRKFLHLSKGKKKKKCFLEMRHAFDCGLFACRNFLMRCAISNGTLHMNYSKKMPRNSESSPSSRQWIVLVRVNKTKQNHTSDKFCTDKTCAETTCVCVQIECWCGSKSR